MSMRGRMYSIDLQFLFLMLRPHNAQRVHYHVHRGIGPNDAEYLQDCLIGDA